MVTQRKDLRSGNTVWSAYKHSFIPHENIRSDLIADVLIVGAGLTGAFVAEELSDLGLKTIIIDRRLPTKGSTFATTALLQYEIDVPLVKLQRKIGLDNAAHAWRRSYISLHGLAGRIKALNIKCDLNQENSLYINGNLLNADELHDEQKIRQQIGLQSFYQTRRHLLDNYSLHKQAGLLSINNYSCNPCLLAGELLKKSLERKAKLFYPVELEKIEKALTYLYASTNVGPVIQTKYIVFTTGYEVPEYIKKLEYRILSTWAFATSKNNYKNSLPMIWESSDPYLYIRRTFDGRIICGGEDEKFIDEEKRDLLIPKKIKALKKKLKTILPDLNPKIDFSWCGSFGVTPTGLPLIGAIPGMKNCFAVMAFGGNGIVHGRIGAEIIRNWILGKEDPDEKLYKFIE